MTNRAKANPPRLPSVKRARTCVGYGDPESADLDGEPIERMRTCSIPEPIPVRRGPHEPA